MRGESLSPGVSPGAGLCTVEDPRGQTNEMTMCWGWERGMPWGMRSLPMDIQFPSSGWEIRKGFRLQCCGEKRKWELWVKCGNPHQETSDISGYARGGDGQKQPWSQPCISDKWSTG